MHKHKILPKTLLRYLLDEYVLFQRHFTIQTSISSEKVGQQLHDIAYQKPGCWRTDGVRVSFNHIGEVRYFTIHANQRQRRSFIQTASAEGKIENNDNGGTIITGRVLMSSFTYWLAILILAGTMLLLLINIEVVDAGDWAIMLLYCLSNMAFISLFWLRMYLDRNFLLKQIQTATLDVEQHFTTETTKYHVEQQGSKLNKLEQ